jgi:small subunit ribosomal protein S29
LLEKITSANKDVLSGLSIQLDHSALPFDTSRANSLYQLAQATREAEYVWPLFHALWRELLVPGRPPLMFALDGLSHMMRFSKYRSPDYNFIHSHDLSLLGLFADALGGKTKFVNGAAIIGVTSKSNSFNNPSMDKALEQAEAMQKGEPLPPRESFAEYDERVFQSLNGVKVFDVSSISKVEARSLLEYWAASGVLRLRIDERNVSERWTLAGNGNIGEMERASLFVVRL